MSKTEAISDSRTAATLRFNLVEFDLKSQVDKVGTELQTCGTMAGIFRKAAIFVYLLASFPVAAGQTCNADPNLSNIGYFPNNFQNVQSYLVGPQIDASSHREFLRSCMTDDFRVKPEGIAILYDVLADYIPKWQQSYANNKTLDPFYIPDLVTKIVSACEAVQIDCLTLIGKFSYESVFDPRATNDAGSGAAGIPQFVNSAPLEIADQLGARGPSRADLRLVPYFQSMAKTYFTSAAAREEEVERAQNRNERTDGWLRFSNAFRTSPDRTKEIQTKNVDDRYAEFIQFLRSPNWKRQMIGIDYANSADTLKKLDWQILAGAMYLKIKVVFVGNGNLERGLKYFGNPSERDYVSNVKKHGEFIYRTGHMSHGNSAFEHKTVLERMSESGCPQEDSLRLSESPFILDNVEFDDNECIRTRDI